MKKFVISDIHGQYQLLVTLLEYLNKNYNKYKLYLLGDIVDRGEGGYDIYKLITSPKYKDKTSLIMGNHELMLIDNVYHKNFHPNFDGTIMFSEFFYPTVKGVLKSVIADIKDNKIQLSDAEEITNDPNQIIFCKSLWSIYGKRIKDYARASEINIGANNYKSLLNNIYLKFKGMADYFKNLPVIAKVKGADDFLLVHSGYVNAAEQEESPISNYVCKSIDDIPNQNVLVLLFERVIDYSKNCAVAPSSRFDNHVVVGGHTQTALMTNNANTSNDIFYTEDNGKLASICIDGGVQDNNAFSVGQLNCLCLDDLTEIVIKKQEPYKVEVRQTRYSTSKQKD